MHNYLWKDTHKTSNHGLWYMGHLLSIFKKYMFESDWLRDHVIQPVLNSRPAWGFTAGADESHLKITQLSKLRIFPVRSFREKLGDS